MSQITTVEYNGLELGNVNSGYGISRLKGLEAPPISTSEQQKTEAVGSNIFAQKYNSRIMQFRVEVMGDTVDDFLAKKRAFIKAYQIEVDDFITLTMWNGDVRKIKARVTDGPEATYEPQNVTINTYKLEMTAENPYFLDNATKTYSAGPPIVGGFPIPGPLPMPLGATSGGKFTINNGGDVASFAPFTITGPVTNPSIRNATTGEEFQINNTVPNGSSLQIFRDQQGVFVVLDGVTNWRRYLVGDLFAIEPGNNLIKWNGLYAEYDEVSVTETEELISTSLLEATFNDPFLSA